MIASKQMKELRGLDGRLRELGQAKQPDLQQHVMFAIVSGEVPKMKPVSEISKIARRKIVTDRYSRHLEFGDVFSSCNGYEGEMKQFNAYETKRKAAVAKYAKESGRIMLLALNENAEADDIREQLEAAADRAGLYELSPPKFGEPEED